jgi:hypothetical protein
VIEEHKQREARRAEKSKDTSKDDDDKEDKDKSNSSKTKQESESKVSPIVGIPDSSASSTSGKHRQFALHRGIFSMRERDVRAKEQGAKAKEVGKGKIARVLFPSIGRHEFILITLQACHKCQEPNFEDRYNGRNLYTGRTISNCGTTLWYAPMVTGSSMLLR